MYCVVQTGSRMLRLECGTTRRTFSCAGAAQAKPASSTATRRLRSMRKSSDETTPQVSTGMRESVRLPLAFFCSGAAALLFEVLWFRALGRVVGNTVWAGALVLTAFMLGMALGGVLAARWSQRIRNPGRAFAAAEATVAVAGTLLVWGLPEAEKIATSAARPGCRRPRSRMPKKSAGSDVMRRTASSRLRTFLSLTQVPSTDRP